MSFTRRVAVAAVCVVATRSANAEPERTSPEAATVSSRHSIYLEGLGKGGLWGNTLRITPPMCITRADVDFLIAVLDEAFRGL